MFKAMVETLAHFLAKEESSTYSETLSHQRSKAPVDGLAGTLL